MIQTTHALLFSRARTNRLVATLGRLGIRCGGGLVLPTDRRRSSLYPDPKVQIFTLKGKLY